MNTASGDNCAPQQDLFADLAFSGEITASVTHELNNVLGTIEQVTGLIEDLADTEDVREGGLSDRLLDIVGRVTRQCDRGTALIKHLNAFAHLSDSAVTECNLGELVERMVALSARFAGMRKVQLGATVPDEDLFIKTSPFHAARAVFGGIKRALQIARPPEPVRIALSPTSGGGVMYIDVRGDDSSLHTEGFMAAVGSSYPGHEFSMESRGDGLYRITVILQGSA